MFKVGEKVECLVFDESGFYSYKPGDIFIVEAIEGDYVIFRDNMGDKRSRHYSEFETVDKFEIPFIEASKRLRIEPFSLETSGFCEVDFENSPLGGVKMHLDNELAWDAIDLRHFAATLNALADKMEEAENV